MGHEPGVQFGEGYSIGAVRISRRVLRTVIEEAVLGVRGVAGVARALPPPGLGRPIPCRGIGLATHENEVAIDLYLIAASGENLARIGAGAREAAARAVEESLGMRVVTVNVYMQDVV